MPPEPLQTKNTTVSATSQSLVGGKGRKTALVTGSVAITALLTSAVIQKARRANLSWPDQLPKALDAEVLEMEIMEGPAHFYRREGTGVPIVLLHSINAAGSSFEMRPLFDHFASTTDRPIFALDWFGFGLSSRPPVQYTPGLYQRQLRRFLSEHVKSEADIIALSLASEYAATVASAFPVLVRRLVCISPTGLGEDRTKNPLMKMVIGAASGIGAFELAFSRLTNRESIHRFYAQQIFSDGAIVPDELVDYAVVTTHVKGAHFAPRWFIDGTLFMDNYARRIYSNLQVPTQFIIPEKTRSKVQQFDRATEVTAVNPGHVHVKTLPTGLLPHWENADLVFSTIDDFLEG